MSKRILLSDIPAIHLFENSFTKARRTAPIPQLQCVDSKLCRQYHPSSVTCDNIGGDGSEVIWKCTADLPSSLRFGNIDVSCEGWSRPGDPYVLEGSCGLSYSLVKIDSSLWDEPGHRRPVKDSLNWLSTILLALAFTLLLSHLYRLFKQCYNHDSRVRRLIGNSDSGGAISGFFGGGRPDSGPPPPPYTPYPKTSPDQQAGGHWQPGFWTGLGLGSVGGYLFNSRRNNESPVRAGWDRRNLYDWEQPRTSGFQTRFPSSDEGWFSRASSSSASHRDRGEGPSNLGTMRSSSGLAKSSIR